MLRKKRVCLTIVAIAVCVFCGFMLLQGKPKTAAAAEFDAAVSLSAVQASEPINQTGLGLGINTGRGKYQRFFDRLQYFRPSEIAAVNDEPDQPEQKRGKIFFYD